MQDELLIKFIDGKCSQEEAEEGIVSIRNRDTAQTTEMSLEEFLSKITAEIKDRV